MRKVVVIIGIVVVGGSAVFAALLLSSWRTTPANVIARRGIMHYGPTVVVVSPSSTVYPTTFSTSDSLLQFINPSLPILWQAKKASEHDYYTPSYRVEKISGIEQDGETTDKNPSLHELANVVYLQTNGWTEDMQIAADGPMGSEWGYSRTILDKKQVVIFSYTNKSFVAPPAQTTCPCRFSVAVFLSDPF